MGILQNSLDYLKIHLAGNVLQSLHVAGFLLLYIQMFNEIK